MYQSRCFYIINLIDLGFACNCNTGKKLADLLRSKVFATAFTGIRCVLTHKELVSVTKCVNGIILIISKLQITNTVNDFNKPFIALDNSTAEFIAIHINIIKQARKIIFTVSTLRRLLNMTEHFFKRFVKVIIIRCFLSDIKKLRRLDEKAFFIYEVFSCKLGFFIRQSDIIKIGIACSVLAFIDIVRKIFTYIAIEHKS